MYLSIEGSQIFARIPCFTALTFHFMVCTVRHLHVFKDQLEVCLTYSRLLTGIPMPMVFQSLWWLVISD